MNYPHYPAAPVRTANATTTRPVGVPEPIVIPPWGVFFIQELDRAIEIERRAVREGCLDRSRRCADPESLTCAQPF